MAKFWLRLKWLRLTIVFFFVIFWRCYVSQAGECWWNPWNIEHDIAWMILNDPHKRHRCTISNHCFYTRLRHLRSKKYCSVEIEAQFHQSRHHLLRHGSPSLGSFVRYVKAVKCCWQLTQKELSCHLNAFIVLEVSVNKRYQTQIQVIDSQQTCCQTQTEKKMRGFFEHENFPNFRTNRTNFFSTCIDVKFQIYSFNVAWWFWKQSHIELSQGFIDLGAVVKMLQWNFFGGTWRSGLNLSIHVVPMWRFLVQTKS